MILPHRSFRFALLIAVLSLGLAWSVKATVLVPGDFDELVREAHAIVHARVVGVRPQWVDGRRRIESFVTLAVVENMKGDLGRSLTIRVPGGELGGYRSVMIGAPVFHEGDEAILFLSTRGVTIPHILGLGQGVYRIVARAADGRRLVMSPGRLNVGAVPRGTLGRRPIGIPEFGDHVRETLARLGAAAGQSPR